MGSPLFSHMTSRRTLGKHTWLTPLSQSQVAESKSQSLYEAYEDLWAWPLPASSTSCLPNPTHSQPATHRPASGPLHLPSRPHSGPFSDVTSSEKPSLTTLPPPHPPPPLHGISSQHVPACLCLPCHECGDLLVCSLLIPQGQAHSTGSMKECMWLESHGLANRQAFRVAGLQQRERLERGSDGPCEFQSTGGFRSEPWLGAS